MVIVPGFGATITASVFLLAEAVAPEQSLLQYGAVGLLALFAMYAVNVLFKRVDKQLTDERNRADRLEAELRKLNEAAVDRLVPAIVQSTTICAQVLKLLESSRRGNDP